VASTPTRPTDPATAAVAVVIPTHDRLATLRRAVGSVERQTAVPWQLVVVDDASSDGTAEWLATLTDPRITSIVLPENVERSRARNRGLEAIGARCVLFLDDDDELAPGALAALSEALGSAPAAVAAVGVRRDVGRGRGRRDLHPGRSVLLDVRAASFLGWVAPPSQTMFRTDAVRAVGGWRADQVRGEDRLMWLELSLRGGVVFVPRVVVRMEKRPRDVVRSRGRRFDFDQWSRYVEELPGDRAGRDARLIAATRSWNDAMDRYDAGAYRAALAAELASFRSAPLAFASPLVRRRLLGMIGLTALGAAGGRPILRRLERRLLRGAPGADEDRPSRSRFGDRSGLHDPGAHP
jgi:glycosyltransferase involved in cell wall biosynthesis